MPIPSTITTRLQVRNRLIILLSVITLALLCSCSDDDSWAPAYITDFAEIRTDDNGAAIAMTLDDGTTYEQSGATTSGTLNINTQTLNIQGLKPDTLYRAICLYSLQGKAATLYSLSLAFAPEPQSHMDDIKMDPCTIQSIWRGGDYINARMLVQGQDQSHIVAFIDKGIEDRETGYKQLTLYLHHDQNGDAEAFTRIVYLSCPLRGYADDLVKGRDSVAFVVNQEGKGLTTFMLPY